VALNNPQCVQNNEDERDDKQGVNPIACLWEAGADVSTEKAEQPQDDQNYNDSPQHEISPF
jgi:hypothetical protein